jgi:hypothetical protein
MVRESRHCGNSPHHRSRPNARDTDKPGSRLGNGVILQVVLLFQSMKKAHCRTLQRNLLDSVLQLVINLDIVVA